MPERARVLGGGLPVRACLRCTTGRLRRELEDRGGVAGLLGMMGES